ncbi:hypothetical protein E2C01_054536 [Portunus trituberculatus]|uniref:DUF7041 domain-containing protein n=1 Tax=Portunus trituberculatus TaxID=210409 RepID=A0A5B7GJV0_PORTR|nr:hypothetical protein [Portunus trituberculatus]
MRPTQDQITERMAGAMLYADWSLTYVLDPEVQFCLRRVTNATTRADHVLSALLGKIFPCISEWLECKGDNAIEYADLKAYLLQRFTTSPAARVTQLLNSPNKPLSTRNPPTLSRK